MDRKFYARRRPVQGFALGPHLLAVVPDYAMFNDHLGAVAWFASDPNRTRADPFPGDRRFVIPRRTSMNELLSRGPVAEELDVATGTRLPAADPFFTLNCAA